MDFVIDIGRRCRSAAELRKEFSDQGVKVADYFAKTLLNTIHLILPPPQNHPSLPLLLLLSSSSSSSLVVVGHHEEQLVDGDHHRERCAIDNRGIDREIDDNEEEEKKALLMRANPSSF